MERVVQAMKHIQFASPKQVEHIPEKVAALDRANKRLTRLLPAEFFRCVLLSQRMSRVACAKSWHASPRVHTVKGKLSSHTGKVSPPSASMRPANGCSTCPIGAEHYRGRIPEGVPAVAPLVPHASAGTSTSTATMRRDLGITATRSQGLRKR